VLEQVMGEGDPPADDLIQLIFETRGPAAARELFEGLIKTGEVPAGFPEVETFFHDHVNLPPWIDTDLVDRAQRFFEVRGWVSFVTLGCMSLPQGYAVREVALALSTTQGFKENFERRIWQTYQFVLDVMDKDALTATGAGFRACRKLRVLHGLIRVLLESSPPAEPKPQSERRYWDALEETGWPDDARKPLSQLLLAGTVLSFSYVTLDGLEKLGYELGEEDTRAYLHCWNVVGHLLGVHEELLAHTMDEAAKLYEFRWRLSRCTPEGEDLTARLLEFLESRLGAPDWQFLQPVPRVLMVELSGRETTDLLGVELSARETKMWSPLIAFIRARATIRSRLHRSLPASAFLERMIFRRLARQMLGTPLGAERGEFSIPAGFQKAWRLPPRWRLP
jgi:hypothetical protein